MRKYTKKLGIMFKTLLKKQPDFYEINLNQ